VLVSCVVIVAVEAELCHWLVPDCRELVVVEVLTWGEIIHELSLALALDMELVLVLVLVMLAVLVLTLVVVLMVGVIQRLVLTPELELGMLELLWVLELL
jgi:hypothetical protein